MRKFLTIAAVLLFIFSIIDSVISANNVPVIEENTAAMNISQNAPTEQKNVGGIFDEAGEKFVAHRGYAGGAPENSIYAFELAGKNGFWGIETDICQTQDSQFVCMHDETIDRTTDGSGKVCDMTYARLMAYSIDYGTNVEVYPELKIPSFDEYLKICAAYNCVAVIEIKKISDYEGLLRLIYENGLENRSIITGGYEDLLKIRELNDSIPLMIIAYSNKPYNFYTELAQQNFSSNIGILYNYPVLDKDIVGYVRDNGMYCGVWSLDNEEDAKKFMSYGVDFVVTNEIPGLNLMINRNE